MQTDPSVDRHLGIGGTDAMRLVEGDWIGVYEEKVGIRPPADLSENFSVQLGKETEHFHRMWFQRKSGEHVFVERERRVHPARPWQFGHLDGMVAGKGMGVPDLPIDFKHTHAGTTIRDVAKLYMPQLGHYCLVTDTTSAWISAIFGNQEPEWRLVEFTKDYLRDLLEMEAAFWWHVHNKVPPEEPSSGHVAQVVHSGQQVLIGGLKDYDFTSNNQFASLCSDYLLHKEAAATFEKAKKQLKELVPADAATVKGPGLSINRAKNGNLLFREAA